MILRIAVAATAVLALATGSAWAAGDHEHGHDDGHGHAAPQAESHGHGDETRHGGGHGAGQHPAGGHWTAPAEAAARENPVADTAASRSRGETLFRIYCQSCHGPDGRGDGPAAATMEPPPANLAVMAPAHPDGDLAWKIEQGRGPMPAWGKVLGGDQIWDLVNYLKTLGAQ